VPGWLRQGIHRVNINAWAGVSIGSQRSYGRTSCAGTKETSCSATTGHTVQSSPSCSRYSAIDQPRQVRCSRLPVPSRAGVSGRRESLDCSKECHAPGALHCLYRRPHPIPPDRAQTACCAVRRRLNRDCLRFQCRQGFRGLDGQPRRDLLCLGDSTGRTGPRSDSARSRSGRADIFLGTVSY